jgi:Raf kinase inhibitor-like YbhB/YbcL family protein
MRLFSSSFEDGQEIPPVHGKRGENISPALQWTQAPPDTESFALTIVDQDPVARGFLHWLVVDIGPEITTLPAGANAGAMPKGAFEVSPYRGPSPPSGTHEYEFTLYALSTPQLDLPRDASLSEFVTAAEPYTLDVATLTGTFTHA